MRLWVFCLVFPCAFWCCSLSTESETRRVSSSDEVASSCEIPSLKSSVNDYCCLADTN